MAGVPFLVVGPSARASGAERDALAVGPAARATLSGPGPLKASEADEAPIPVPSSGPSSRTAPGRHERPGGDRVPCGAHQVGGAAAVLTQAPLRRVLHGPINRRVEAVARPSVYAPLVRPRSSHPKGAPLLKGAPIRRVIRRLEDRFRGPAQGGLRRPSVKGAPPKVAGRLLRPGPPLTEGGQDDDEADRVTVSPLTPYGRPRPGAVARA